MKIRRLNMVGLNNIVQSADVLFFVKLPYSRLFRVPVIPERYCVTEELFQVLRTLCTQYHKGVFYFHLADPDKFTDIGAILANMDIEHFFVEPQKFESVIDYCKN